MARKTTGNYRYRSSVTGRYVKKAYAIKHRPTTEKERIKSTKKHHK